MFLCPRCGSTTFRSTKLPNGSVERECRGHVVDEVRVALSKEVTASGILPRSQAPVIVKRSARACTLLWSAEDDHLYGVSADDVADETQPPVQG